MPSNRYSRQITLLGEENQLKLTNASILVVGAGGIGAPLLLYLVAGGIGKIGIIDHDKVTLNNLHRQILYTEADIGSPKSRVAYEKLNSLNSEVFINAYYTQLTLENAKGLFSDYDLIIDGSDNFKTRYLVNDVCCQLNKPFISASIFQDKIQIMFFDIQQGCYRCVFPEPPPPFLMANCSDAGVLGATTGMAGSISASLATKFFINPGNMPVQKIITLDSNSYQSGQLPFSQVKHCTACHDHLISWPANGYNLRIQGIELENYKVIDIRERHENLQPKLTNNELHIPFSELIHLPSTIPEGDLLLYCQSGRRSDYAAHFLRKNGFLAFSLDGGVFRD